MPGDNDIHASDGLPAYVASPTTLAKLKLLELYLAAYALACRQAPEWYVLDLFAGSGRNIVEGPCRREVNGSPLVALTAHEYFATARPGHVIAIEKSPTRAHALRTRVAPFAPRAHVLVGSHEDRLEEALALVNSQAPSFAVIDPEGFEVGWTTLERLAAFRKRRKEPLKMELLILFPSASVARLRDAKHWPLLDDVFGCADWRVVLERRFPPSTVSGLQLNIFGDPTEVVTMPAAEVEAEEARRAWVELYAGRIESVLGYRTVLPIRMVSPGGATKYHLVFATDHDAGATIMRHVRSAAPQRLDELRQSTGGLMLVEGEARPAELDPEGV